MYILSYLFEKYTLLVNIYAQFCISGSVRFHKSGRICFRADKDISDKGFDIIV